ncbi:MAG: class I SAM-dependent methyltransferase [Wenzhouxiangella sp.]
MTNLNPNWYLEDDFWRTFGPLMFNEETFASAEDDITDLIELTGVEPGPVLDLGSGPGRHALPLARAGYPVTAVDTSRLLLDQLEQLRGELPIEIVQADMREFRRTQAFDLVLVMWTSFGYFRDETDHIQVLKNIGASLKPGGKLVLDLVGVEYLSRNLEPVHLTEYDDDRLLIERPLLTDNLTRLENEWLLIKGDRVHRTEFSHRVWSAGEISALLSRAGFDVLGIFGDFRGGIYDLEAERLVVVAARSQKNPD